MAKAPDIASNVFHIAAIIWTPGLLQQLRGLTTRPALLTSIRRMALSLAVSRIGWPSTVTRWKSKSTLRLPGGAGSESRSASASGSEVGSARKRRPSDDTAASNSNRRVPTFLSADIQRCGPHPSPRTKQVCLQPPTGVIHRSRSLLICAPVLHPNRSRESQPSAGSLKRLPSASIECIITGASSNIRSKDSLANASAFSFCTLRSCSHSAGF